MAREDNDADGKSGKQMRQRIHEWSTEIPPVAASEQGRAQTGRLRTTGVEDWHQGKSS